MTLRVGLLRCDRLAPHLRVAGDYPELFAALFAAAGADVELVGYDVPAGELPADPAAEPAWLIGGSVRSVYDGEPWIADLLAFIREAHAAAQPTVGVCFGHQAIAHALGGETRRSGRGWGLGVHTAQVVEARPWMRPELDGVRLAMVHQDQVVRLPPGARVLARSAHCDVAMLEVDDVLLGIQGHPEFHPALAEALLDERADQVPAATAAVARDSFATPTDAAVVGRWIGAFLQQRA